MNFTETYEHIIQEKVSMGHLNAIEKYMDQLFAVYNVDVEMHGRHFIDRLNDMRNKPAIESRELLDTLKEMFKKYGKVVAKLGTGKEAVIKDFNANINIPFMVKLDKRTGMVDLILKTIMRKKDFKTNDKIYSI